MRNDIYYKNKYYAYNHYCYCLILTQIHSLIYTRIRKNKNIKRRSNQNGFFLF